MSTFLCNSPCEPPASAVPAGRCLREPAPRPGPPAGRGFRGRNRQRQRCFRPVSRYFDRIARPRAAARGLAACDGDARRPRRLRTRHPRSVPGCPDGGLRLPRCVLRGTDLDHAPPAARRARVGARRRGASCRRVTPHHRRRRSSLLRSLRRAVRLRRATRNPRCRDPGGQVSVALVSPLQRRRHRRDGDRRPPTPSRARPI